MENIKRPETMERITTPALAEAFIEEQVAQIRAQVGDKKVLLALSGGVDSSVVAALLIRAIGSQLVCVHVNHGLLRKGEPEQVVEVFRDQMKANLVYVDAADRLDKLAGVKNRKRKEKSSVREFIRVFEEEARKLEGIGNFWHRVRFIRTFSRVTGVKAHHNVGGLLEDMQSGLVEPGSSCCTDEVVGKALGLPDSMVYRQPSRVRGQVRRCTGAITGRPRRQEADANARRDRETESCAMAVFCRDSGPEIHGYQGWQTPYGLGRDHPRGRYRGRGNREICGDSVRRAVHNPRSYHRGGSGH